jgi:hypothetical protein
MVKAFNKEDAVGDLGFQTQILKALDELPSRIKFPDNSNKGRLYGLLAMWKRIKSIADNRGEALLKELQGEELIVDPKTIKTAGTHTLGTAGRLEVIVDVTQPRREFNLDWFATELQKRHKVPPALTKSLYEEAKRPGTSQTRTIKVTEKGVVI